MVSDIQILQSIYRAGRKREVSIDWLSDNLDRDMDLLMIDLNRMFTAGDVAFKYLKEDGKRVAYVSLTSQGTQRLISDRNVWIQFWLPFVISVLALIISGIALYLQFTSG